MNIEEAIKKMREEKFVYRPSWDAFRLGRNPHIYFDKYLDHSFSCLVYSDDKRKIRHASLTSEDILATDWMVLENQDEGGNN